MTRKRLVLWLLAAVAAWSAPAVRAEPPPSNENGTSQQPAPWNLQAALQQAWRANPSLQAAQDRVHQAEWAFQASGSHPSANLALGSFQGRGSANANGNYLSEDRGDYYVSVTQPFLPLGALDTRRKSAYRDLTQARAAYAQARLELTQEVQDAFDAVLAAQANIGVSRRNLQLANHVLDITASRLRIGSGPRVDQLNATIQRNRIRQELVSAETDCAQAVTELSGLLNLKADSAAADTLQRESRTAATSPPNQSKLQPSEIPPLLVQGSLDVPDAPLVLATLLEFSDTHPRLEAARESLEQSHHDRVLSQQQTNPTPAASFAYDLLRPTYVFGLSLSVPLDWGAIRNEVKQKEAVERERQHLLDNQRRSLTTQVQSAFQAYQGALQNARTYHQDVLLPAEELTRITEFGYRQSAVPYLQYLNVEQQLSAIRREQVDRQLAVRKALHQLELVVGRQLAPVP